ncbi:MAG: YeeE/YedE thiosulfate transporter family protein [Methanolinea sp.]|nr:YeeE/YedE thiosulfate transporter family protein [Methanolinea sp.]
MIEWFSGATWSPYIAGAGIGILVCLSFLLSDRPLGVSTAYAKTAGMVEKYLFRGDVTSMPYYRQVVPAVDWQWTILVGVVAGGFLAAYSAGTLSLSAVPPLFASAFGGGTVFRLAVAVAGGILMGLGARWAGGCTSGHGISGTLQLSLSSWVAVACFFAGGILTAGILYGFRFG